MIKKKRVRTPAQKAAMYERVKQWKRDHPERMRILSKARKLKNPDYYKARRKRWLRANHGRMLWRQAKSRAEKRGIEFTIEKSDIVIPKKCPILGIPLFYSETGRQCDNSPSIDRIKNNRGYTPDNIIVISWRANYLKKDATLLELRRLVRFYAKLARNT